MSSFVKQFTLICSLIALFVFPWVMHAEGTSENPALLIAALEKQGIQPEVLVLQQSGQIGTGWSTEAFTAQRKRLEEAFHTELRNVVDRRTEGLMRYEAMLQPAPHTFLQIAWVGKEEQGRGNNEPATWTTYLVVEHTTLQPREWRKGWDFLTAGLSLAEIEPILKVSVQGKVNAALSEHEQQALLQQMVHSLEGHIVEGVELDSITSWTGYSPLIHGPMLESSEKINFQVAAQVDEVEKSTIVTLGTPVIIMEY